MSTIIQENTATGTIQPVLTATAEDYVWLANFAELGLSGVSAFAVLDTAIGMHVMVDERLDADARNSIINTAVERLIERKAERFAVLDHRGELYGGAA